jgi:sphinganine-1-phosphate aldolase
MERMDEESHAAHWKEGKVSGAVYRESRSMVFLSLILIWPTRFMISDGGEDVQTVIMAAIERYCISNPLHPDVFPGTV